MKPKILQIPLPGGSGNVPTGAIQFKDDWPGLFLRGDTAIGVLKNIRELQKRLAGHPDKLVGCMLYQLGEIADIIENHVVVGL